MQGFTWLSPNTCSVCNWSNDFWLQIDNPKIYLRCLLRIHYGQWKSFTFRQIVNFFEVGCWNCLTIMHMHPVLLWVISKCVWFTGAMCSKLSPFIWERVGYLINAVFSIDVCMRNNKKSIMHVLTKTRYSMMYC